MRDRNEKRFDGLTAQCSPRAIGHGSGNHQRDFLSRVLKTFRNGKERRFRVERVEDGFHNQKVHVSFDERLCLIEISLLELIERDRAESGIVYIG